MAFDVSAKIGTMPQTRIRILRKAGLSEIEVGQTINFREETIFYGKRLWKKSERGRIAEIRNVSYPLIFIDRA